MHFKLFKDSYLMKKLALVLILFLAPFISAQTDSVDLKSLVSRDQLIRHLNFLGSDLFEGRAPGTLGGNLAAKYLALEFDKFRLTPKGSDGTFYQNIPLQSKQPARSSKLNLHLGDEIITCSLFEDFLIYGTGSQFYIPDSVELIFVGYGIVAPEFDYNDYQNFEVDNKIVVFIDGEPLSLDSTYFDGQYPTVYSLPEAKQRIALSRGALGTILIPNLAQEQNFSWDKNIIDFSFPIISFAASVNSSFDVMMNPEISDLLFTGTSKTIENIIEMHNKHKMEGFPLKVRVSFAGSFKEQSFLSPNVVGMIKGNDPKLNDSYVLISAHYDHLGIDKTGDVFNGADDNGSGTVTLLELAKAFQNTEIKPKRSVVFLWVTAEEVGMLGSKFYTENPLFPMSKTVACINLDMVGRVFEPRDSVWNRSPKKVKDSDGIFAVTNNVWPALKEITTTACTKTGLKPDFSLPAYFLGSSDHASFEKKGVAVLNLSTGYHADYHKPTDETEKINFTKMKRVADLCFLLGLEIANSEITSNENKTY